MKIIPDSINTMEKAMDVMSARQRVIASNLANVDTPGYKAQKLDFEASLRNAMNGVEQNAMVVNESESPALTLDGNNVDMEGELGDMSRNKTVYNLTAQLIAAKLRSISQILEKEQ